MLIAISMRDKEVCLGLIPVRHVRFLHALDKVVQIYVFTRVIAIKRKSNHILHYLNVFYV